MTSARYRLMASSRSTSPPDGGPSGRPGSSPAVGAWHEDEILGFARAVTDGVLRAYVEDVVVAADRRNAGIGQALLDCLIDALDPIPVITLFCSPDLVPLYERHSFRRTKQIVMHRT